MLSFSHILKIVIYQFTIKSFLSSFLVFLSTVLLGFILLIAKDYTQDIEADRYMNAWRQCGEGKFALGELSEAVYFLLKKKLKLKGSLSFEIEKLSLTPDSSGADFVVSKCTAAFSPLNNWHVMILFWPIFLQLSH